MTCENDIGASLLSEEQYDWDNEYEANSRMPTGTGPGILISESCWFER